MLKPVLKLVIVYNAPVNEYSVCAHNQSADEAQRLVETWGEHLLEGCKLLAIEQHSRHSKEAAQDCKTCRYTVKHKSGLTPTPKFVRRD